MNFAVIAANFASTCQHLSTFPLRNPYTWPFINRQRYWLGYIKPFMINLQTCRKKKQMHLSKIIYQNKKRMWSNPTFSCSIMRFIPSSCDGQNIVRCSYGSRCRFFLSFCLLAVWKYILEHIVRWLIPFRVHFLLNLETMHFWMVFWSSLK